MHLRILHTRSFTVIDTMSQVQKTGKPNDTFGDLAIRCLKSVMSHVSDKVTGVDVGFVKKQQDDTGTISNTSQ